MNLNSMSHVPPDIMHAYLEHTGHSSGIANNNYLNALTKGEDFPGLVITNITSYQLFYKTVGFHMVGPLLSLVFHERNNFQDPWKLANIFRGFGSKHLSLSTVIDLFNNLEVGPRKEYVSSYIQAYKSNLVNYQNIDSTLDAFGAFSGLLMEAIRFVENCFQELGHYKYEYYTKLCHARVRHNDLNHLQLEFIKHNNECGIGNHYQVKDLTQLTSLACCDNEVYVKHVLLLDSQRALNTHNFLNKNEVVLANQYTAGEYVDLLKRIGAKTVVFNNQEIVKGM